MDTKQKYLNPIFKDTPKATIRASSQMNWRFDGPICLLFISSLIALIFEINPLGNTLGGLRLFWITFIVGLIIGGLFAWRIIRIPYFSMCGPVYQISTAFTILLSFGFLLSALASNINRSHSSGPIYSEVVYVNSKGKSVPTRHSQIQWYLFIQTNIGEERIQVSSIVWEGIKPGSNLKLALIKGFFGFPYVTGYSHDH